MSKTFAITNMDGYANKMRVEAFAAFVDVATQEMADEYITVQQTINLINSKCSHDIDGRALVTEKLNDKIFDEISTWIYNVDLAKRAAQGLIECAWDSEKNTMIFWKPKDTNGDSNDKSKRAKRGRPRKNKSDNQDQ